VVRLTVGGSKESAEATELVPPSASMMDDGVFMPDINVRVARTCQEFAKGETTFPWECGAIGAVIDDPKIVGARLKALRLELGYKSQTAFAEKLGIEKNTYNPYEKGTRALTFETALKIRRNFGVSVDWLFFGDLGMTSQSLMLKLGRFPGAAPDVAASVARRRRKAAP
jgi:transcriptional regulator with XRE-family HTH domain